MAGFNSSKNKSKKIDKKNDKKNDKKIDKKNDKKIKAEKEVVDRSAKPSRFGSKKEKPVKEEKSKNPRSGNPRNSSKKQRSFNVDERELTSTKKIGREEVSERELEQLAEKIDLPRYIPKVKDCDEKFFIHMINHSKSKDFEPFMIGDFDRELCESIEKSIEQSREELKPGDVVDLSDGNRIRTLER